MQHKSILNIIAGITLLAVLLSALMHLRTQSSWSSSEAKPAALHPLQEAHPTHFSLFQALLSRDRLERETNHSTALTTATAEEREGETHTDTHTLTHTHRDSFQVVGSTSSSSVHHLRGERRNNTLHHHHTHHTRRRNVTVSDALKVHNSDALSLSLSLSHSLSLLRDCRNQTQCITPSLQLTKHYNVYYCKHVGYGVRFYFLAREGLLLHPNLRLVEDPHAADVIIYLPESAPWKKTECAQKSLWHKIVMLDESDGQSLFEPHEREGDKTIAVPHATEGFLLNFKRSYVRRDNGAFKGYMPYATKPNVFPMTYTVAEAYVRPQYKPLRERSIQLLCSLRGSDWDPVRERVREWVTEYGKARGLTKYISGEINHQSRTVVSRQYFNQMYDSKVIVTSNPSHWEGDFRLCEAFASGALIFVDYMFVPRNKPFLENKHVIYYNNANKTDLFDKLDRFLSVSNQERNLYIDSNRNQNGNSGKTAEEIAAAGYLHAMRYHRAANLMDYVFRTLHAKEIAEQEGKADLLTSSLEYAQSVGGYTEHGYVLRLQVLEKQKQARRLRRK